MEVVAQTDYQDIYRITDGVLFMLLSIVLDLKSNLMIKIKIWRT